MTVTAAGQDYSAERLVLAGGALDPLLLAMLGAHLPITLTEEQVTYFATPKVAEFTPDRFGVYGYLAADGLYYGIPVYGEVATKIGIDGAGPVVTPESRTFARDEARVRRVLAFLGRYLPAAVGPELYTRTCCYDLAPDRDFIVDYVPGSQRVLLCAGAGHAGKFAALLGRIIAELALDGSSRFPDQRLQRHPARAQRTPTSTRPRQLDVSEPRAHRSDSGRSVQGRTRTGRTVRGLHPRRAVPRAARNRRHVPIAAI